MKKTLFGILTSLLTFLSVVGIEKAEAQQYSPIRNAQGYVTNTNIEETIVDGEYCIIPENSNKVVDVEGGPSSSSNGKIIQIWDYIGNANQRFRFVPTGDGFYYIVACNSNKILDVQGGSDATQNGAKLQLYDKLGGANQQFSVELVSTDEQGNYTFKLIARHSNKALDVEGGEDAKQNGARIQQWDYNGTTNQKFRLRLASSVQKIIPPPPPPTLPPPRPNPQNRSSGIVNFRNHRNGTVYLYYVQNNIGSNTNFCVEKKYAFEIGGLGTHQWIIPENQKLTYYFYTSSNPDCIHVIPVTSGTLSRYQANGTNVDIF